MNRFMTRNTRIISIVTLLSLPLQTLAAPIVQIDDTIAGLGANAVVEGAPPNAALDLVFATPNGSIPVAIATDASGAAEAQLTADDTVIAGTYRAVLRNDDSTVASTSFSVVPDSVDAVASTVAADRLRIDADGEDASEVTVHLVDRYGNPVSGRPVALVSARADDRIDALGTQTDADGAQRFLVSTLSRGRISLRAVDLLSGQILEDAVSIDAGPAAYGGTSVAGTAWADLLADRAFYGASGLAAQVSSFDVISKFQITVLPSPTIELGVQVPKVIIRAVDRNGKTVQNYIGTAVFSSTDPKAVLPNFGEYTFRERDLGEKEFPIVLKFGTAGEQIFRAEDKSDASVSGEAAITVTRASNPVPLGNITISEPKNGDAAGETVTVRGKGPPYANIIIFGGLSEAAGETDGEGNFSIAVSLDTSERTAKLHAEDDTGDYISDEVTVVFDKDAPDIGDVTFDPAVPTEKTNTLVRVNSEEGLKSVRLAFPDDGPQVELKESPATPGLYQAFFIAPAAGSYQATVTVSDTAGNGNEIRVNLQIGMPGLPRVMNVFAEPRANAIALTWDPIPEDADEYRVYVGESPSEFAYSLDTGKPVTKATVAGLTAGTTYYFAVTALRDGLESVEKSEIIGAQVLGLNLQADPQDGALKLSWEFPDEAPVSSFLLEYGIEEGSYTERRLINGAMREFLLNDLINGVTYLLKMTPVAVTGTRMEEMSDMTEGTPDGSPGFRPGRSDPVPFDPAAANLTNVPEHSKEGVPSWVFFTALGIAAIVVLRRTRRVQSFRA